MEHATIFGGFGGQGLLFAGHVLAEAAMIEDRTGNETRTTVLGYTQRGGSPTAYDRIWATRVGASAYSLAAGGRWAMMPVVRGGTVEIAAISDVVAEQRRVPAELYDLARVFF